MPNPEESTMPPAPGNMDAATQDLSAMIAQLFPMFLKTLKKEFFVVDRAEITEFMATLAESAAQAPFDMMRDLVSAARKEPQPDGFAQISAFDVADNLINLSEEVLIPAIREKYAVTVAEKVAEG